MTLLAVLVGASLIGLRYWNELGFVHWSLQLAWVGIVATAIGFVTGRRGWAAALAAYAIGVALWVTIELRPSPPWAGADVWDWQQWGGFILTLTPVGLGAAVLGWVGSRLGHSRRSARASRTHT